MGCPTLSFRGFVLDILSEGDLNIYGTARRTLYELCVLNMGSNAIWYIDP